MKILICGPEGSGKTTLAKPFAELLGGIYVNKTVTKMNYVVT